MTPILYRQITALSSAAHAGLHFDAERNFAFSREVHVVPLTCDEFFEAQRFYPIVFAIGDAPVSVALLGLNEGENLFVEPSGGWKAGTYVPAYVRRHPFLLARHSSEAESLSLCFDPEAESISEAAGVALFSDGSPSEETLNVMRFCEEFERAANRTEALVRELTALDLLIDGEATVRNAGAEPAVYKGFRIVDEARLHALPAETVTGLLASGALAFIHAHLISLKRFADLSVLKRLN